jgi:esterase
MELFYREMGKGKPIIILHGLFGTSDNWQILARKLGEKYHVYTVDLRNHGQSFHSEDFDIQWMARDVAGFIDFYKIKEPVIIGHSMGGKIAMKVAIMFPDSIEKFISVDIGPQSYPVRHEKIIEALNSVDIENVKTRKEVEQALMQSIPDWGIRQFLMKNLKRLNEGGFTWKMNLPVISRKIENIGEAIGNGNVITKPGLFVRGSESDYILDEDWSEIEKQFPNSKLITIEGAAHWIHVDKPKELLDVFLEFI